MASKIQRCILQSDANHSEKRCTFGQPGSGGNNPSSYTYYSNVDGPDKKLICPLSGLFTLLTLEELFKAILVLTARDTQG